MSEKKRTKTQRAILHAAKGLYEKHGVGGIPFDDIADAAGVCRTTVFNHFADAGELQQALAVAEIGELIEFGEQSHKTGLNLITALLDKLIDDTANYPRVMARLTNATILGGESGRVGEIERLIARNYEIEFGKFTPDASVSPELLAQMTMGLYYGQVNHLLAYGLPFEAEKMRSDMHTMLDCLLKCRLYAKASE
ncbi:MAG: TetR/AcrR family transcriptional regulator [Eubacteriales bacterium]|nr:TetR/AcrR family transcriptional regulator [Eubacteriales bacterium]